MHHGSPYLGFIIFIVVLLAIDFYVFQGVKTLTAGFAENQVRIYIHIGYWILSVAIIIYVLFALRQMILNQQFTGFVKWAFNIFIIFIITKLTFIVFLFGEDIYRGIAGIVNSIFKNGDYEGFMPDRRKFISQAGIMLAAFNFSSLLYGAVKGKYQYKLHKQIIYFEDLPEAFNGFTISQLSDIHVGSFDDADAVQRGIDLVKAQNSDLFVFTGDIVNNKADELLPWMDHFNQIRAPYGQFSILGNHDYGEYVQWPSKVEEDNNLKHLKELHAELGYKLLLNENIVIEKDGETLSLIGVENWGKGFVTKGDLNKALEGIDPSSFKILLSHDPSHWDEEVKQHPAHIHLTLSGHTHGMQMGIETSKFKFSPVRLRYKNWAGIAKENGKYLYVNRGFGFIGYFGRVGIWPEVAVIELRRGKSKISES